MRDLARICAHHTGKGETCVYLGSDVEASSVAVGPMPYGVDGMPIRRSIMWRCRVQNL